MIATCPACGKRYRIADDAIPATGRQVRCAACGHGWTVAPEGAKIFADRSAEPPPPVFDIGAAPRVSPAAPAAPVGADVAPMAMPAAAARTPSVAPLAVAPAGTPLAALQAAWSPDDDAPPRRRWGWLVAGLLVVVAVAALAVVEFAPADTFAPPRLGLPAPAALGAMAGDLPPLDLTRVPLVGDALDRLVHPPAAPASPLRITAHGERSLLANGTRVLTVSGTVANPTDAPVGLTAIDAALVDAAGHAAVRWRIAAPVGVVAAHGSAAFEAVEANFPAGATILRLTPR